MLYTTLLIFSEQCLQCLRRNAAVQIHEEWHKNDDISIFIFYSILSMVELYFFPSRWAHPKGHPQRGYSLYRGTHFKDNEGFEANWMQCRAFQKKFCIPRPLSRPRQNHRVQEYRPPIIVPKMELKTFSLNRSIWVPKDAKFYTDSKSESKTEIKCMTKKLFSKNCFFASFF